MKVNWFSPLPPAKTGIAVYTETLIQAFRKRAEVTLWTDQQQWDKRLNEIAHVRSFDPQRVPWADLNGADVTFYNIGNNRAAHKGIWEVSRLHPGIVVLHDFCLQHFFADLYLNEWKDRDAYGRVMERYYGEEGRRAARRFSDHMLTVEQLSGAFPLTPLALENALAAVVHNREWKSPIAQPPVPVCYVPLPYSSVESGHFHTAPERGAGPPYRLIIFGFIGVNRRVERFLEAWAGMPEKSAFRLRICGRIWDADRIGGRIRELGLSDLAELRGHVPDDELHVELSRADVAINLRYPTMGEASLTQLLIWAHALPSIVSQVGWYAGLPKEAAVFVRAENEVEDIRRHLRDFLERPKQFAEMGRRGRQILDRDHTPDAYFESLLRFAAGSENWSARASRRQMAERTGADMRRWIAPAGCDVLAGSLASAIWDLGAAGPSSARQARA